MNFSESSIDTHAKDGEVVYFFTASITCPKCEKFDIYNWLNETTNLIRIKCSGCEFYFEFFGSEK